MGSRGGPEGGSEGGPEAQVSDQGRTLAMSTAVRWSGGYCLPSATSSPPFSCTCTPHRHHTPPSGQSAARTHGSIGGWSRRHLTVEVRRFRFRGASIVVLLHHGVELPSLALLHELVVVRHVLQPRLQRGGVFVVLLRVLPPQHRQEGGRARVALLALQRAGSEGGQRGSRGNPGEIEWSSVDACEPQNPTRSEEYQRHLQGVFYSTRGPKTPKTLVTNVVNTQDSQEQAPGSEGVQRGSRGGPEEVQRGFRWGSEGVQMGFRGGADGVQRGFRWGPEAVTPASRPSPCGEGAQRGSLAGRSQLSGGCGGAFDDFVPSSIRSLCVTLGHYEGVNFGHHEHAVVLDVLVREWLCAVIYW
eukprot:336365-Prorocentrum_minimum.AAC.1